MVARCDEPSAEKRFELMMPAHAQRVDAQEYVERPDSWCLVVLHLRRPIPVHLFSKAEGAIAMTTVKDVTMSAQATNETRMMLPLDAGNLPRIT